MLPVKGRAFGDLALECHSCAQSEVYAFRIDFLLQVFSRANLE